MRDEARSEIDAVVDAFYAAFDNRDGRTPTTAALVELFAADATVARVAAGAADRWTPTEFAEPRVALLTTGGLTGFHEWETSSRTDVFGDIASRFSTYEKEGTMDGAPFSGGGAKLLQLRRDHGRWLISALLWEDR
jgi:hypothetical protein